MIQLNLGMQYVTLRHVSLVGQGQALTLIQQILSGQIDGSKAVDAPEPDKPGSFTPPRTWQKMCAVLLDFLLPANAVEEGANALASFEQSHHESVQSYALRFRTALSRFQAAVERESGSPRTPWNCMTVALWQRGLKPAVRVLIVKKKPSTSLKPAVVLARRLEVTGLTASHVSSLAFQPTNLESVHPVPAPFAVLQTPAGARATQPTVSRRAVTQQQRPCQPQHPSRGGGGRGGAAAGAARGIGRGSARGFSRNGGRGGNRRRRGPYVPCTYVNCRSRESHPIEDYWQRRDDENGGRSERRSERRNQQPAKRSRDGHDSE